ncbi:MAG TPA: hypothetical protein VK838_01345 [Candidatus Limnocylindrales bacterium]|nr:hypothetical protein [Candidatus Limnocylindrales bacterium]
MTGDHRVAAGTIVFLLAALLTVAWLFPVLALAVVWPALFVVPGWAAMAIARPRIGSTGRLGLAIVLSVAVSAHAVYWLSLLTGGYQRWTIFAVAAVLLSPLPAAAAMGGWRALAAQLRGAGRGLRRDPLAFAFAGVAAAFVGLVLDAGLWKATATGVSAGGSNWSDLGVHLSIAQSLNAGNFPPQVPYFAGAPLVYHWFADFHSAIAARAAGLFAIPAFVGSSAIMAGALALLVHGLARRLLRGRRARRAALLAAVLVIFGGGLGWIRLVTEVSLGYGDPISLVTNNSYDNSWYDAIGQVSWPYFRIPSVMGTGLLVHRATTYGLPILVGAVLLLLAGLPTRRRRLAGWRDRPMLIGLAGVLGAMLAPFHFFYFPAWLLLALLWVLLGGRLVDRRAPRNAALVLLPLVLAVPFAAAALANAGGSGALQVRLGWESAPLAEGPAAVAFFYATNLGLPFGLALAALLVPRTPWRWFLAAWVVALFAVPNLLQVSVVSFDMNKYFQAMWIAVALLAAWLIRRWPWPAVAVVLLISVPSPLLVSAWTAFSREEVLSWEEVRAAEWIASGTPDGSVFVTDGWLNAPTDPAGRLRLLTFTPYVANLGFDPDQRVAQTYEIYCAGDPARSVALMRELGAAYVIDERRPADCSMPTDFAAEPALEQVYASDSIRIYRLADAGRAGP